MRKTAYPDASTAIAITGEMALSIKSIIDGMPGLGNKTKNRSIADEIKRVADTSRLISLRVVTIVCDHAHELAAQIESEQLTPDAARLEAISSVMNAVYRYVNAVAAGKIASGFSLHGAYLDLMRFLPNEQVALRQEFFLPVSPVYGPNSPNFNEGRFVAEVARYNDEFRQAMKRHETTKDLETINAMRTTLVTMETKNPPSNFRMLLSLAISFMDIAMRNGGKISKENEPLIGRLDRELSGVVKGDTDVDDGTVSWFMFVVGQANQFSARIRAFQDAYELPRLIEESQNTTVNDQTVASMRSALDNAQRTWEASLVVQGDVSAARSACFALVAVSNTIGDYALKTMAMAIGSLADGIVEKRVTVDNELAVFGASIIVAMNERLDRLPVDPKGGRSAADTHRERVRAVLSGKRPSDLSREMQSQGGHVQAILDELGNDLSSVEQIIDQCLRDGAKENKREETAKLFNVVKSALSFVNLGDAAIYATTVGENVESVMAGLIEGKQPTVDEKRILADSVMMLHRYVQLINLEPLQAGQALDRGMALFAKAEEVATQELEEEQGSFDVCNDEDLGPIFFEEAKGVVADLILPGIEKLRINIDDEPTMLDVRRGFHTLKGSSRMVELNNLGLVGQYTEYVLNMYRDNRNLKPNSDLLNWLEDAAKFIDKCVLVLEQNKPVRVNSAPYEAVYNHFAETGVFERVDIKSAPVQQTHHGVVDAVIESDELNVHIPETGSIIMLAPDIIMAGRDADEPEEIQIVNLANANENLIDIAPISEENEFGLDEESQDIDLPDFAQETQPAIQAEAEEIKEQHPPVYEAIAEIEIPDVEPETVAPIAINEPQEETHAILNFELVDAVMESTDQIQEIVIDSKPETISFDEPLAEIALVDIVEDHGSEVVTETMLESTGEVLVGDVSIPTPMFNVFIVEARAFQDTLQKSIMDAVNDARPMVDFEVMRMAHSLAGMGRVTGLKAVTHLAGRVEDWASVNQDRPLHLTDAARAVLMDAMEALDAMIVGVADKIEPQMEYGIVERLGVVVEEDERRISMAQDMRSDVTESVLLQINESDVEVSDEGVSPSITMVLDIPEAQEVSSNQSNQEEGASAPRTFRHEEEILASSNETVEVVADSQASSEVVECHDVDQESLGRDVLIPAALEVIDAVAADQVVEDIEETQATTSELSFEQSEPEEPVAVIKIDSIDAEESVDFSNTAELVEVDQVIESENYAQISEGVQEQIEDLPLVPVESMEFAQSDFANSMIVNEAVVELVGSDDVDSVISDSITSSEFGVIPPSIETTSGASLPMYITPHEVTSRATELTTSVDWLEIVASRDDDVDEEMFEIFVEEANERFEEIDAALGAIQGNITDKRLTNVLKRAVHTLKGSGNTAGCRKLGAIFHYLEDMMDANPVLDNDTLATLQSGVDVAFNGLKSMRAGKSIESAIKKAIKSAKNLSEGVEVAAEISDSSQTFSISEKNEDEVEQSTTTITTTNINEIVVEDVAAVATIVPEVHEAPSSTSIAVLKGADVRAVQAVKKAAKAEEDESSLRVSSRLLDKMVKTVGEVNISRSRMSMNVDITKVALTGLATSLERMYGYLRQVEMEAERQMSAGDQGMKKSSSFDALHMDRFTRLQELTRRVAEAQNDVVTQQSAAIGATRDMEEALANQFTLVGEISSDLDQVRQVRVSSIVPALKRVVRAACRDTNKKGEIFFDADVEIDRGILSKIMGSLEHVLRNAVAHGIEDPAVRAASGKDETGTIEFCAYQDGGEVVIEIRDDGRGMDTKSIYQSAVRKNLIKPGTQLTENQIRELVFEPGFSTAEVVSDIAGRGVGLDVVRSDISAMGGRVVVESAVGTGTIFVLRVPATLTVIAGAAVTTNGHMYVIPVSFIDRLVRVNGKDLDDAYRSRKLLVKNGESTVEYEFWGMWQIAGSKVWDNTPLSRNSILLMSNDRVAVHIDDIRPAGEFVFRPLGPQVANSSGLIGSTISSTGNAALVLDPARVARTLRSLVGNSSASASTSLAEQKKSPLVLVVDDSTTVRKVTTRLLKREGFRHAEAENGMKALEMLQRELPDVILMDIEMPVMNGYEASEAIRATPETMHIPIIMITSRVGESHRQRAMEIGVNEYLGKPYNESDLMALIRKYTEVKKIANG